MVTLLTGKRGMKKEAWVRAHTSLDIRNITENISNETLDDIRLDPIRHTYIIDLEEAALHHRVEKLQNTILKFIEEPPEECDIFIFANDVESCLPTIVNRCWRVDLPDLTPPELLAVNEHIKEEHLPYLCTYIDAEEYDEIRVQKMAESVDKALEFLPSLTPSNALKIANLIDWGDGEGYDLNQFIRCMQRKLWKNEENANPHAIILYKNILTFVDNIRYLGVNKRDQFELMLLNMKREVARCNLPS